MCTSGYLKHLKEVATKRGHLHVWTRLADPWLNEHKPRLMKASTVVHAKKNEVGDQKVGSVSSVISAGAVGSESSEETSPGTEEVVNGP